MFDAFDTTEPHLSTNAAEYALEMKSISGAFNFYFIYQALSHGRAPVVRNSRPLSDHAVKDGREKA